MMIASAWIIVISAGIPGFIWTDVVTSGQIRACQVPASINPDMVNNYIVVTRIAIFFAPLGVTIFSYFGIWYKLIFSNKKVFTYLYHDDTHYSCIQHRTNR